MGHGKTLMESSPKHQGQLVWYGKWTLTITSKEGQEISGMAASVTDDERRLEDRRAGKGWHKMQ